MTTVIFKAPKVYSKVESGKILEVISKQKKLLKTEDWKVIGSNKFKENQTIVVLIDDSSLTALKSHGEKRASGIW